MPDVPDRILRSIKFPQLSAKYNVLEFAEEHDEYHTYYYGDFCTYQGKLYQCSYSPIEYDDTSYIEGPFNPDNWYEIEYPLTNLYYQLDFYANQYEPYNSYRRGQCVSYADTYYYCCKTTPIPAGVFNFDYWIRLGVITVDPVTKYQNLQNKFTQLDLISEVSSVAEGIAISPNQWTYHYLNEDTDAYRYAAIELQLDPESDYLISYPYLKFPDDSQILIHNDLDWLTVLFKLNNDSTYPEYPMQDANWQSLISYGMEEDAFLRAFSPLNIVDGSYYRIRKNRLPLPSSPAPVTKVTLIVCSPYDEQSGWQDRIDCITEEMIEEVRQFLKVERLSSSGTVDLQDVDKLVLQDYTEVYKELNDKIVFVSNNLDYTDSLKIPLDEGNVALKFVNFNDSWNDIDIELRVYNNLLGNHESINLKDKDKQLYIVNEHQGKTDGLMEWDYFKLRFTSSGAALSSSQVDFVNQNLNILRKPKSQSNPHPLNKNNIYNVNDFINLAESFVKAQSIYVINQPTFLQTECTYKNPELDNFNIDAATLIQACLRGYCFDNTPYSCDWRFPFYDELILSTSDSEYPGLIKDIHWKANTSQYPWAINAYEDLDYRWSIYTDRFTGTDLENSASIKDSTSLFNECGLLAKWMIDKGWRVDSIPTLNQPERKFNSIQKGDIIFFSEQMGVENQFKFPVATMFPGYQYRNITHAAIVKDIKVTLNEDYDPLDLVADPPYEYTITVITTPSLFENYLKQTSGHFEYSPIMEYELQETKIYTNTNNLSHYLPSISTISMVCRPNLNTSSLTHLEKEARELGLHTVPENETQLNIIKKCRMCSDIEWTPAIDYDRPIPLTNSTDNFYRQIDTSIDPIEVTNNFGNFIIDGKFKAGKTYKGMPWTANIISSDVDPVYPYYKGLYSLLLPEQFLSVIGNEDAITYIDPTDDKVYPFYGWNEPVDLIRFVFGTENCRSYYFGDGVDGYVFPTSKFSGDLEAVEDFPELSVPIENADVNFYINDIKLGDIFVSSQSDLPYGRPEVIAIITDIVRNELNQVIQVELTEATRFGCINIKDNQGPDGNLIRRKMYTIQELKAWLNLRDYDRVDGYNTIIPDSDKEYEGVIS